MRAVDVFGFAGGFTLGMAQAGFTLVGKRELPQGFGVMNCEVNRHLLGDGWTAEATEPKNWTVTSAEVVFGNPPCSGFSVMSAKTFRGAHSPINECMWNLVRYASKVRPPIVVFESVGQAYTREDGLELMRLLREELELRTNARYTLYHVMHNAYSVGGAALRRRYFWVASRVPFGIDPLVPVRLPTLNHVIGDLQGLSASWERQPYRIPGSWWSNPRRSPSGLVDGHIGTNTPLTRRIIDLMNAVEWKPGEHIAKVAKRCYDRDGHLPDSWKHIEQKIVEERFQMGFTTPTRWRNDTAGRVITGGALALAIHPVENRTITHREAARVMGFPDDWRIGPLRSVSNLPLTWGKGITVDCGRWIGHWVKRALDGDPGERQGVELSQREFVIDDVDMYKRVLYSSGRSTINHDEGVLR